MFAILKTGGKQYRVGKGSVLKIEKINAEIGDLVKFSEVLMFFNKEEIISIGNPNLENINISAEILEHGRHEKINIIKFKRRKHSLKRQGHRQFFTKIKIKEIIEEEV